MPKVPIENIINPPENNDDLTNYRYYMLTPCCGGPTLYFQPSENQFNQISGVVIYEGSGVDGYIPSDGTYSPLAIGECHEVSTGLVGDATISQALFNNLPQLPVTSGNFATVVGSTCIEAADNCPDCPTICYLAITCDGIAYESNSDLSAYVGQSVTMSIAELGVTDVCAQIVVAPEGYECSQAVDIFVDPDFPPCSCDCNCYAVVGSAQSILYVDCDGNVVQTGFVSGLYGKFCSKTVPIVETADLNNPPVLVTEGPCLLNGDVYECPEICYELVDCQGIKDPIYTNSQSLYPYASLGQIVKIEGHDNCWTVNKTVDCECAIDVTVLEFYNSCKACVDVINYKLTNCDDEDTIVYTSSDLSDYVGQVIKRGECPGCWKVEQVDGPIPSDVVVTVSSSFLNCEDCAKVYWQLTDCEGIEDPIVTYTDLSDYNGLVITLNWCPDICWQVGLAQQVPETTSIVFPENTFQKCEGCIEAKTCICVNVINVSDESFTWRYTDCTGLETTIQLLPAASTGKLCVRKYSTDEALQITEYGDCTDGQCPPDELGPQRSVRPGYDTGACTKAYHDKVQCAFAEQYYKEVLEKRYGISDCCDKEETIKWEIKKELLDIQLITDPDYECYTKTTCCTPTVSTNTISCNS